MAILQFAMNLSVRGRVGRSASAARLGESRDCAKTGELRRFGGCGRSGEVGGQGLAGLSVLTVQGRVASEGNEGRKAVRIGEWDVAGGGQRLAATRRRDSARTRDDQNRAYHALARSLSRAPVQPPTMRTSNQDHSADQPRGVQFATDVDRIAMN